MAHAVKQEYSPIKHLVNSGNLELQKILTDTQRGIENEFSANVDKCFRGIYNSTVHALFSNIALSPKELIETSKVISDVIYHTANTAIDLYEVGEQLGLTSSHYEPNHLGDLIIDEVTCMKEDVDFLLKTMWDDLNK